MNDMVCLMTCGSVDDGKSTLIGRLLWESKRVFEDQLPALARDSARYGTQGDVIDLALLVDGLQAEREQNITIDVGYRFFSTRRRRFIVADTPGHEQYTRNMVTGASTSQIAVLVVNAGKGLLTQTLRHARIVSLLGVRHLVMTVNKMDLVHWDEGVFLRIVREFQPLVTELNFESFQPIPISALYGDNITERTSASWYLGPSLLDHLEEINVVDRVINGDFRMPVQYVNRPDENFRGYCGRVASGSVNVGDRVRVMPSGIESRVRAIVVWQGERSSACAGDSITVCLEHELDVNRGNVISAKSDHAETSDQFECHVIGLSQDQIMAGRSYLFNLHTCQAVATITAIRCQLDVKRGARLAARSLTLNDIGIVTLSLDRQVCFETYERCRRLGSFILVDRLNNETVGAGIIDFALRGAGNIHWQTMAVDKRARALQKLQRPICVWLTGISGAGKSTIASLLEKRLFSSGRHTYVLDGDNIRHGLNRDLGFSAADRVENVRRVTEVARLLVDAGLVVIVALISPFRAERDAARSCFELGEFIEVFVDTPIEECERRDPKGLYAKARRGELVNFTGFDSSYERPDAPEIRLDTLNESAEDCVGRILKILKDAVPDHVDLT
jgi:bifunctional enzyme CysN/CysC